MYAPRHVPQKAIAPVARVKADAFKMEKGRMYTLPSFEGFCGGSWWDVDIVQRRDKYYLVKYLSNSAEEDAWVPLNHLRLRTRKSDDWDCNILRGGMDVSIFGIHSDLVFHPTALYDAKIIQLSRVAHDMKCTCRFHVKFYCREEEHPNLGRTFLTHSSATREVDISNVSILQQPVNFTFEEILRSYMLEKWLSKKWGNDAYFLRETKLYSGEDKSMDTLLGYPATRSDKHGASFCSRRGLTLGVHDIHRNATGKGKAHADGRNSFDQKQKLDAANKAACGLKHYGHDIESDVRTSIEVLPDRFEEVDLDFHISDQPGAKSCRGGRRGIEMDYDSGNDGLGVGRRAYYKRQKGTEFSFERENYDECFVKVRNDDSDHDGVRSSDDKVDVEGTGSDDNLDIEGKGNLGRGDYVAVMPSHRMLDGDELVSGVKKSKDKVSGRRKEKQEFRPCQTSIRSGSTQKEEETRKRHRSI